MNDDLDQKEISCRKVVLLTGMSGAGISTALKSFEDLGYEAVDNLRLGLVPALIDDASDKAKPLAVAVDTRNANFAVEDLIALIRDFGAREKVAMQLVFLDCSDETLQRRFSETRRRHPLAVDRPVTDGIRREREMIWRLREEADRVIDTSLLSIHDLRRLIVGHFTLDNEQGLTIYVTSFSFKFGVPREADFVFDARFMANPYWDPKLRNLTGQDAGVQDYVRHDPDYAATMEHLEKLIVPLLPRYRLEGKSYLTIAIGCTGGRHRSVTVAEDLATILAGHDYIVGVGHRDMSRAANKP